MSKILGGMPSRVGVLVAGLVLVGATTVHGAEFNRVDWTPGGGFVGDTWTFQCPAGGSVFVAADAFADRPVAEDEFETGLDLVLEVFDGQGNLLAAGDDEFECAGAVACGAGCPALEATCGQGLTHSVVVRDAGVLEGCEGGGAYALTLEVTSEEGRSLPNREVKLGGGVAQNLPAWIRRTGLINRRGPVIDDGLAPIVPGIADALGAQSVKKKK